jgi:hypothetical protein
MTAQDHPTFKKPENLDVRIWRYMSLAKFLWMLQRNSLYFSRSDLMGDPFEGHYSKPTATSEDSFVAAQMTDPVFATMGGAIHRRNFRNMAGCDYGRHRFDKRRIHVPLFAEARSIASNSVSLKRQPSASRLALA